MELAGKKKNLQIQLINYFNNANGQDTADSKLRVKKFADNMRGIGIEFDEVFFENLNKYPDVLIDMVVYSEMNILTKINEIKNKLQGN